MEPHLPLCRQVVYRNFHGYNAFPDGSYAEQVKLDRFLMPLWIGPDAGGDPR